MGTTFTYKDASEAEHMLKRFFLSDQSKWPEPLLKAIKGEAKIALGLSLIFLDKLLLADTSIPIAQFVWADDVAGSFAGRPASMLIDAQAIEHLDILPPYFGSKVRKVDGSLFTFLSQGCSTAFGKRMLKRWTVSPLYDVAQIEQRQDAVSDLVQNKPLHELISAALGKIPDIERMLTRIFTYSIKSKIKAFYVDAQAIKRITEFHTLLTVFKELNLQLADIAKLLPKLKSQRLRSLVTVAGNKGGVFPDTSPVILDFESMVTWRKTSSGKPVP